MLRRVSSVNSPRHSFQRVLPSLSLLVAPVATSSSSTRNFSTIADVKFDRSTPPAAEEAYARFAAEHGLCDVPDFYRGVTQAYYALATALGSIHHHRAPASVLKRLMMTSSSSSSSSSAPTRGEEMRGFIADEVIAEKLNSTKKEDALFRNGGGSRSNSKKKDAETATTSSEDHHGDHSSHTGSVVEKETSSSSTSGGEDQEPPQLPKGVAYPTQAQLQPHQRRWFSFFEDTSDPATSEEKKTAVKLVRATLAPVFRDALYQALRKPVFPSNTNIRSYHSIAYADEKIEALQISSFDLIPRENGDDSKNNNNNNNTNNTTPSADAVDDASADHLSAGVAAQKLADVQQKFDIVVTVNVLLQVPPARYIHNFEFFRSHIRTDGLEEHYGGSLEKASNAADATARVLALSNVYFIYKALDWLSRKVIKTSSLLDPRALPLHMLGLSEDFPAQPSRYAKAFKFVYDYDTQHWRVVGATAAGNYVRDFDPVAWRAENGGVPP